MSLDPGILTLVQTNLVSQVANSYQAVLGYATNLLYLFVGFEIVLFGFYWVLQGSSATARLFLGLLKIGLLIFIINNFGAWLGLILQSIGQIGGDVVNLKGALSVLLSPGNIWQYGYDNSIKILKFASTINNVSIDFTLSLTALSTILVFGLISIQLIVQLAAFYIGALCALLFMPIGVFKPTSDFAFRAIRMVLQLAVRLLTMLIVLGLAVPIWNSIGDLPEHFNLNQVFGLFFSGLVFLVMMTKLPGIIAQVVGQVKTSDETGRVEPTALSAGTSGVGNIQDVRAAVALDASRGSGMGGPGFVPSATHVQVSTPGAIAQNARASRSAKKTQQATQVAPSISPDTLRKLKQVAKGSGE